MALAHELLGQVEPEEGVASARSALKSLRCHAEREAGPRCTGVAISTAMAAMGAMDAVSQQFTNDLKPFTKTLTGLAHRRDLVLRDLFLLAI